MIKNDLQLKQALERLATLRNEKKQLAEHYHGKPPRYLIEQLQKDEARANSEIDEYNQLRQLPLEKAVELLAERPVAIENVGELLAKLRIAAKFTQEELAQILGWEQANVSRFESANYSSQTIGKISEYLDGIRVWLHLIPSTTEKPTTLRIVTRFQSFPDAPNMIQSSLFTGSQPYPSTFVGKPLQGIVVTLPMNTMMSPVSVTNSASSVIPEDMTATSRVVTTKPPEKVGSIFIRSQNVRGLWDELAPDVPVTIADQSRREKAGVQV